MKSLTDLAERIIPSLDDEELYIDDDEYQVLKTKLPRGVNIREALEFGFFEYKNRYWMRRKDEFEPVSNFTLKVLYLIKGANPKRIVELTNFKNRKAVIDFAIEDLISLEKFKGKIESQGNFLFEGRSTDLGRIKNKLFSLEIASTEIHVLGWQKTFWAFANGIYYQREWHPVDQNGMVVIKNEHYYIPYLGATTADDDEDLRNFRRFVHVPSRNTVSDWSKLFVSVYGDNGKVGIAFCLYAIFSDIAYNITKGAPMLFLFGQKSSGKGSMASSMLSLFGVAQDQYMLGGASTVVGFMRRLAQFRNGLVWMDEYKNGLNDKIVESLKNVWDRIGYVRGVMDNTNKTKTTPVTSSAILSGQEMPNAEPALFSRVVLLEFNKSSRDQGAVERFDELRKMEDAGITNCAFEIMNARDTVQSDFLTLYSEIAAAFRAAFAGIDIVDRQIANCAIICAVFACVEKVIQLPFTASELMRIFEKITKRQVSMMKTADEVQQFFEAIEFLLSNGAIKNGRDVQISEEFVKIRMQVVYPHYREAGMRQKAKIIDKGTLQNYLENSAAYAAEQSKKSSHRFSDLANPTNCMVFPTKMINLLHGVDFMESLKL